MKNLEKIPGTNQYQEKLSLETRQALERERRVMNQVCEQCGKPLGYEYFLGPVCGKCCKANHKKVTGGK